jgi:excinuclease ABC subunit C
MINQLNIPKNPGVYLFKDKHEEIIYIGKAKNLKNRVSSYFKGKNHSLKTQFLVKNIKDVDFIVVDSEIEALLLENKLIKQHKPKYNINLKDSKTFAYIALSKGDFPKIYTTRRVTKDQTLFGPYTDGTARKELLALSVSLFKLRVCRNMPKRACLNYHIGLCSAPCEKKVTKEEYDNQVKETIHFLKGNTKPVLKKLKEEMKDFSKRRKYEVALEKRRQIEAIEHLGAKQHVDVIKQFDQDVIALIEDESEAVIVVFSISKGVISGKKEFTFDKDAELLEEFVKIFYSTQYIPHEIIVNFAFWKSSKEKQVLEEYLSRLKGVKVKLTHPQRGDKVSLYELAEKNAYLRLDNAVLKEIKNKLNLPTLPRVIECFDVSNLGDEHIVAAMTQWVNGKPNRNGNRKFKIQNTQTQDDFSSMREVVFRRYRKLRDLELPYPDLIIIDGGAGQLSSALTSLKSLGVKIPVIGLAKKREEIYLPEESVPRQYDKNSEMMLLIRNIRNSVHKYVLGYNKKRRRMKEKKELQS